MSASPPTEGTLAGPRRRPAWVVAAVGWAVVVAVLLTVPADDLVGDSLLHLPRWLQERLDVVVHAALFFVTAFLFHRAWGVARGWWRGLLVALALTVAYGAVTEAVQLWVPGRTAQWRDLGANVAGAVCYALAAWLRAARDIRKAG